MTAQKTRESGSDDALERVIRLFAEHSLSVSRKLAVMTEKRPRTEISKEAAAEIENWVTTAFTKPAV